MAQEKDTMSTLPELDYSNCLIFILSIAAITISKSGTMFQSQ